MRRCVSASARITYVVCVAACCVRIYGVAAGGWWWWDLAVGCRAQPGRTYPLFALD
jgi:hypothetical protein